MITIPRFRKINFHIKFPYKEVDWPLLLVIMIGHLPNIYIAILAYPLFFILYCFIQPRFYLHAITKKVLISYCIIYGIGIISGLFHFGNINNMIWGILLILPLFTTPFLISKTNSIPKMINSLKIFLIIQALFFIVEIVQAAIEMHSINPFTVNEGIGDGLGGTLFYPVSFLMTISLAVVSFIMINEIFAGRYKGNIKYLILCFILLILPGSMGLIFCYIVTFITFSAFMTIKNLIKLKVNKIIGSVLGLCIAIISILCIVESDNVSYGFRVIGLMLRTDPPIKVQIWNTTFDLFKENNHAIITGIGLGNYTSRAAAIVSGEYLTKQPVFIPATPSEYMNKYVLSIWNRDTRNKIVGGSIGNSIINDPITQYISIFAESGIIALILLLGISIQLIKIGVIHKNYSILSFLGFFLIYIYFLNDFNAYPSVIVFYWTAIRYAELIILQNNHEIYKTI